MGLYAGEGVGRSIKKKFFVAALMASTCICAVAATLPKAYAQTSRQTPFNIPAGSLSSALTQFGRQSGLQVTYLPAITSGKQSSGASGTLSPSDALGRILAGSGLSYSISGDTVTVGNSNAGSIADDGSTLLKPIIITGKTGRITADTPYETPGSSAYISSEQIEQRRGTSVGDFLSGIPGVINGDNRNSGSLDVNIRGMQGQGRVPVIVDGASQEASVYRGYMGTASRSYVDPDFISLVSIEKGPSASADATGATGGVVRMSTIGVTDILLPGKSFGVRLKGGFNTNSSSVPALGTWGGYNGGQGYYSTLPSADTLFQPGGMDRPAFLEPTGGSGSVAVAGTTEYVDIVAAYARRKNGNYHAGGNGDDGAHVVFEPNQSGGGYVSNGGLSSFRAGEEVLNTSYDNQSYLLKGTIRLDGGHSLELGWNKYKSEYGEILPTQINVFNRSPYQADLSTIELDTYTARYHWSPEDNDLIDLKVDAFRSETDVRVNSALRSYYPSFGLDFWSPSNVAIGSERYGVTASNTSRLSTSMGDFKLEYGGAWTKEDIGYPDGVDAADVTWKTRQGSRREVSGFTSLEWKPYDWLTLNGSLRYSSFDTFDDTDSSKHSADGWSPVASVTVEPLQGFQIYGKYGSVIRSPSIFETLKSEAFVADTQNFVEPERARSIEIGLNHIQEDIILAGDKLRFHAAYFDNHINNYITRANVRTGEYWNGWNWQTTYGLRRVNLDYAKMRGVELSAEYDTGKYFGGIAWNHYTKTEFCVGSDVELIDGYSRCAAGGIRNSYSLLHVPPKDTLTLNLGARLLDDKLAVGGRVTYTGSRMVDGVGDGSTLATSELKPPEWNPYTLVDIYASYKVSENATFDLAIDNLTDRYYIDALSGSLMPGPGRTVRVNFTTKF